MTEKMIKVAGKEFPASNEKEIKETIKKLRHEDKEVKEVKEVIICFNFFKFIYVFIYTSYNRILL
jgi:hypothetical protein